MQVVGTSISAGKICARIDYHALSPVATGVSEVIQTSVGPVASCNISEAGDYIVLQLSYQLRDTEPEGYHDLPGARGAWSPLLARVSWDPEPDGWSRGLQLMAASIGISFLLLFVCVARRYRANADMDRCISFREYEAVDEETDKDSKDPPRHFLSSSISNHFKLLQSLSKKAADDGGTAIVPGRSSQGWNRWKVLRAKSRESTTQVMNDETPLRAASLAPSKEDATEVLPFDEKAMAKMNELLEMDARDARDTAGRTALHLAASMGNLGVVRALLDVEDGSSDPRRTDYQGQTPVHAAAREGHNEVVGELVMFGCMREANPRRTSAGSDTGRCRRTHQHPFSVNHQDQCGNTPLHLAAAGGHTDVIRALERTAVSIVLDLSVANNDGWTPLQLAAQKGHTEAVMRLLKLKPRAAFPRAVSHGERCNASMSPLHIASRHGHVKLVRCLLDWISKHEDYLDAESSDDDDSRRSIDMLRPHITRRQTLAARSFKALRGIATRSKKKLHSMIQWKLPQQDVLDRGFTLSPVAAVDVEEQGLLVSTIEDAEEADILVSGDTAPLLLRLAVGRPLSPMNTEAFPAPPAAAGDESDPQNSAREVFDAPQPQDSPVQPVHEQQDPGSSEHPAGRPLKLDNAASKSDISSGLDSASRDWPETLPKTQAAEATTFDGHSLDDASSSDPPTKGSSSLPSGLKGAVELKKKRVPGIPPAAKQRPRVAAQAPGRTTAAVAPRRAGPGNKARAQAPTKAAGSTTGRIAASNAIPAAATKRKNATSTLGTKQQSATEASPAEDIIVASSATPKSPQLVGGPLDASGSSRSTTPLTGLGPSRPSSRPATPQQLPSPSASRPSTPQLSEAQLGARHEKELQITSTYGAPIQVTSQQSTPSAGRRRKPSTTDDLHRRLTEPAPARSKEEVVDSLDLQVHSQSFTGYHTDDSEDKEPCLPVLSEGSSHPSRVTGWD